MSPIRMTLPTCLILRAVATGRRHGFQIMEATGLGSGTVYPVLRRLERELALESEWEDEEEARSAARPRRRVYQLTAEGERWAERAIERLAESRRLLSEPSPGDVLPVEGRAS